MLAQLLALALARSVVSYRLLRDSTDGSMLPLTLAAALAYDSFRSDRQMPMTRTTISFTREDMELLRKAAKRQGSSVSQFVREAALMRARMASDKNPYPMRDLAEQLRAIGDQGYALAEKAVEVAEDEAERKR